MEDIKDMTSAGEIPADDVLFIALELGEHILRSGGEISRAEDTITRICRAYGALHVDVTAVLSMIVLTVDFHDSRTTCTRRIANSASNNLGRLTDLNDLSRRVCRERPTKQEFLKKMANINGHSRISTLRLVVGSILSALGFAIFFSDYSSGVTAALLLSVLVDSVLAGLVAFPLSFIMKFLSGTKTNEFIIKFIVCFFGGMFALLIGRVIPTCHPNIIMIGNIMNVISGVAFTNSFRDLFGGDIMSGLFRFCNVLLDAIAIAAGYAVAIIIFGGAV